MSKNINQHGLSRHIPLEIRRQLRQEAGFGCIVCGLAIATYEHIEPEFRDATRHDPSKMAYLCAGCHDRVTRKVWSKDKIREAKQKPYCSEHGRCRDAFDVGGDDFSVIVGNNEMTRVEKILVVESQTLLGVKPPVIQGGPYQLSGRFYDSASRLLFEIDNNEWMGDSSLWDIECVGPRIIIKTAPGQIALQILCSPRSSLTIEKLDMAFSGVRFIIDRNDLLWQWRGREMLLSNQKFTANGPGASAFVFDQGGMIMGHAGEGGMRIEPRVPSSGFIRFGSHK